MDDQGYYYYNMRKNFAEFDQANNNFKLYDAPATIRSDGKGSVGNFFPFNKGGEVFTEESGGKLTSDVGCASNTMNHHLGMTVELGLRQPLGGTHSELYGTINFETGDVYVGRSFDTNGIPEDPSDAANNVTYGNVDMNTGDINPDESNILLKDEKKDGLVVAIPMMYHQSQKKTMVAALRQQPGGSPQRQARILQCCGITSCLTYSRLAAARQ